MHFSILEESSAVMQASHSEAVVTQGGMGHQGGVGLPGAVFVSYDNRIWPKHIDGT